MTPDKAQWVAPPFQVMAKPIGPICNLNCKYCFYIGKEELYPDEKQWRMPPDVLESYIRQTIETQKRSNVIFVWQGGEPMLLGVDYFARVVELQAKYAGTKRIENALQTNGTLLDDEWCAFLAAKRFLVGISLDGPRQLHDRLRVDRRGGGTFDQVMHGVDLLRKHSIDFNTLTVVHRENSRYPLEVYRFLKEAGSHFLQFLPAVERLPAGRRQYDRCGQDQRAETAPSVTEWSVDAAQYGIFLCTVFDEWVRQDVGKVFVQLFDVALERWLGMPSSLCVFAETCGDALVLEHNGDLFACDHYVSPEFLRGNITTHLLGRMALSDEQQAFGRDKLDALPQFCSECPVRFACNGECPKHRFEKTPDGAEGLNYLCAGYKKFFRHIDAPMRFMAEELRNERPPANVMAWMLVRDTSLYRRNERCFCGSGKKYKHCHGS